MQPNEKIIKCYNATANNYAAERINELSKKHLDRLLLKEFASVNKDKGLCADFGCGPGQTTKFLFDHGMKDIIGVDISSGMVEAARRYFPKIKFETGDIDVDIDLFFFQTEQITELLHETGFRVTDALERYPYEDIEWATRRAYLWAEKK